MALGLSWFMIVSAYLVGISLALPNSFDPVGNCIIPWDTGALVCNNPTTCSNAPLVALGTMYSTPSRIKRRSLQKRDATLRWCQIGTETYVEAQSQQQSAESANDISQLYDRAIHGVDTIVEYRFDEVIGRPFHSGVSSSVHPGGEIFLAATDANDHQLTYGVLGSALRALKNYGEAHDFGFGEYKIFDGPNQVGDISVKGSI